MDLHGRRHVVVSFRERFAALPCRTELPIQPIAPHAGDRHFAVADGFEAAVREMVAEIVEVQSEAELRMELHHVPHHA